MVDLLEVQTVSPEATMLFSCEQYNRMAFTRHYNANRTNREKWRMGVSQKRYGLSWNVARALFVLIYLRGSG